MRNSTVKKAAVRAAGLLFSLLLILGPFPAFSRNASAKEYTVVTNGLVSMYDGTNNTRSGHQGASTVWEDLVSDNDVTVVQNDKNFFTKDAYRLSGTRHFFPRALLDLVNGREFTVELVLGAIYRTGSSFSTFVNNSGNDYFSLFLRSSGDYLEFKQSGSSSDRPKVSGGRELAENSTVSIVRSLDAGTCLMYVDGVEVASGPARAAIGATGELFFGHNEASRAHDAEYRGIRFYSRALSEEEIRNNARADGHFDESHVPPRAYALPRQEKTNVIGGICYILRANSDEKIAGL